MVKYILEATVSWQFSKLALLVRGGTLQLLVEATPQNLGRIKRWWYYSSTIWPEGLGTAAQSAIIPRPWLCGLVRMDLQWW
jgi:hypothetical protein